MGFRPLRAVAIGAIGAIATVGMLSVDVSVAAAFSYPGYVTSYYMNTVSTATLYDMGCTLGTARYGGSAPQDAVVFLDFGQAQLRNGVYGTWDYSGSYRTVTQIRSAVVAYAHGFYHCTWSNTSARVSIAVGTNNYADFCEKCGMTDSEVVGFGNAWANMVDATNTDILNAGYASQASAFGAADIEVGWGRPTIARSWVTAYDAVNEWALYDFGDAGGCPRSGSTKTAGTCGYYTPDNGVHKYYWKQNDLYFVSWQSPSALALPEIYTDALAQEWQQISKWATLNSLSKISFQGVMATTSGYTPSQAWTDLVNRCAADSATALSSLRFATMIQYH